jgi:hypothetical protein
VSRRAGLIEPASVDRYPSLVAATKGLGPLRELFLGEGGVVYAADGRDGWYLVTDEGLMAGMLDEEDADLVDQLCCVSVRRRRIPCALRNASWVEPPPTRLCLTHGERSVLVNVKRLP